MRKLTDHIVENDSVNHQIMIDVTDEPGAGGANHGYMISWPSSGPANTCFVPFQKGTVKEAGVNGVTNEALLAIVIDRLRSFQAGPFACEENALSLNHCEKALMWLQRRTRELIKRDVEGTHQK